MIESTIILGSLFIAGIMTFIIRHIYKREWARKASNLLIEIQEIKGTQFPQRPTIRDLQTYVEHLREVKDGKKELDEDNRIDYGMMYR